MFQGSRRISIIIRDLCSDHRKDENPRRPGNVGNCSRVHKEALTRFLRGQLPQLFAAVRCRGSVSPEKVPRNGKAIAERAHCPQRSTRELERFGQKSAPLNVQLSVVVGPAIAGLLSAIASGHASGPLTSQHAADNYTVRNSRNDFLQL